MTAPKERDDVINIAQVSINGNHVECDLERGYKGGGSEVPPSGSSK